MRALTCLLAGLAMLAVSSVVSAEVARVSITARTPVAGGQAFGAVGAYESLTGTIEFALDPRDPHNQLVTDLSLAPKAADGRVHFGADLIVLQPTDTTKGNGVLLFEVVNRGRIGVLEKFNSAPRADTSPAADVGNGYLMRQGYTLVFVGWEFDLPPGTIRLEAPAIDGLRQAITVPFILDRPSPDTTLANAPTYLPANPTDMASTLTVRDHYWDRPTPVDRARWRFVNGASGPPRLALDGGFESGRMYEVTYVATGARLVGAGLAAIRDAASAFRYRTDLPVHGTRAYGYGFSQDGRFLREFLYDGFNVDEQGRRVFDGVWSHIAGAARGSFNERFGMPAAGSVLLTPVRFPFTTDLQTFDGERGSLLQRYRPAEQPKIIFSNTAVEYWGGGRAAALIHASPDGMRDLPVPDNVRIYFLAGTQHEQSAFPPRQARGQQRDNPVPQREVFRALLAGFHQWITRDVAPPPSRYPRLADGSLTRLAAVRFPTIPGVADPRTIAGPGQVREGRVTRLPHLVPQVDADGNDLGGIRVPDVSVPMATNTGWNFRSASVGGTGEIYNLVGSYIPFATTRAAREARHDPRPSITERYRDRDDYLARLRAAADALVKDRYLLSEDVEEVVARGRAQWEFVMGTTGGR